MAVWTTPSFITYFGGCCLAPLLRRPVCASFCQHRAAKRHTRYSYSLPSAHAARRFERLSELHAKKESARTAAAALRWSCERQEHPTDAVGAGPAAPGRARPPVMRARGTRTQSASRVQQAGSAQDRPMGQHDRVLQLAKCSTLAEVDELYRPYRPKRRTRASEALDRGIGGPAAQPVWCAAARHCTAPRSLNSILPPAAPLPGRAACCRIVVRAGSVRTPGACVVLCSLTHSLTHRARCPRGRDRRLRRIRRAYGSAAAA
jgi:hypothetical protein